MAHVGWDEIWKRALELLATEPIEVRIGVGLALALAAVMMLEGLRTTFRPRRPKPAPQQAMAVIAPQTAPAAPRKPETPKPEAPKTEKNSKNRQRIAVRLASPKVIKVEIKPFRAARPQIRHNAVSAPMVTAEGAPFSPLPPNPS
jgi:hypothetical protein